MGYFGKVVGTALMASAGIYFGNALFTGAALVAGSDGVFFKRSEPEIVSAYQGRTATCTKFGILPMIGYVCKTTNSQGNTLEMVAFDDMYRINKISALMVNTNQVGSVKITSPDGLQARIGPLGYRKGELSIIPKYYSDLDYNMVLMEIHRNAKLNSQQR